MGQAASAQTFADCLSSACAGRADCYATSDTILYQASWVERYNLAIPVEPVAVTRPETAQEISAFVTCAADHGIKVQAKSGGHSYANYGLGGDDGALVIDMQNFQQFEMNTTTWQATVGAGHELGDLDKKLTSNGNRAMAHGICPSVGLGGHATIGGLGPNSRMWGPALDHIVEVEVVTADGAIQRANEEQNSDLYFAIKGAASGFGIVTEFVVNTHPAPGTVIEYSYSFSIDSIADLGDFLFQWQELIYDPDLDRRFGSECIIEPAGGLITGTFYGTEDEWNASGIPDRMPKDGKIDVFVDDWLGVLAHQAEDIVLYLAEIATPFTASSLAFAREDKMSNATIHALIDYIDEAQKGTLTWFLLFDASGGAVADVPMDATAYSHRDAFMYAQAYGIGIPVVDDATRTFIKDITVNIQNNTSAGTMGAYPGYVDPTLGYEGGVEAYWGANLDKLVQIKDSWDPQDVFHNPQSVRPSNASTADEGVDLQGRRVKGSGSKSLEARN